MLHARWADLLFFFSSRRRHTRFKCDWSSDVCSSDLACAQTCKETSSTRRDHMPAHKVVKHDDWLKARKKHLAKEKEFTWMRDQLSRERRDLPWELVEKHYTFEGEHGTQTLSDLFQGRTQLVIYRAMFNPQTAGPQTPWTADGQLQRHHRPPESPRHHHGRGLTGSLPEACSLQETDGRKRLQLRLSCLLHR